MKWQHEFRDPVHNFIQVTEHERRIINSAPVQRLRHIHQLALTYMLYPGATHRRFEHSLGVMHLTGELFDRLTNPRRVTDEIRAQIPELEEEGNLGYWRTVARLAALCHDVGHLPFSHAAEHELLAEGNSHETLTQKIVLESEIAEILGDLTPPIRPEQVAKIAIGPDKWAGEPFSDWEALLSDMITGDAFGVDRIDYLLRDSLHAGVMYGNFDHHRLLETLRIIPQAPQDDKEEDAGVGDAQRPVIGIDEGGIHAAESLVLARYFMFTQVYFHHVRVAYDIHLVDFMNAWLGQGGYPATVTGHLANTDNEVLSAIREHASLETASARAIWNRQHYRLVYRETAEDKIEALQPTDNVASALRERYGPENVRDGRRTVKSGNTGFSVLSFNGDRVADAAAFSPALVPQPSELGYVYVHPDVAEDARTWMSQARATIIKDEASSSQEPDGDGS